MNAIVTAIVLTTCPVVCTATVLILASMYALSTLEQNAKQKITELLAGVLMSDNLGSDAFHQRKNEIRLCLEGIVIQLVESLLNIIIQLK